MGDLVDERDRCLFACLHTCRVWLGTADEHVGLVEPLSGRIVGVERDLYDLPREVVAVGDPVVVLELYP